MEAQLLGLLSAGADTAQVVVAMVLIWQHRRVSRIERKIWPEVFGQG